MKKYILPSALSLLFIILCYKSALNGGDFDVYLHASEKMQAGGDVYGPPYFKLDLKYFYSPFFALILIPFNGNYFLTQFIWLLLSGIMLYRSWVLVKSYYNKEPLSNKQLFWWGLISLFFIVRFLLYNISMTQITLFILWGMLESIHLIKKKNYILGSLILALVINVKLLPLVILPYLIYRGFWKEFLLTVGFVVAFVFLPAVFVGWDYNQELLLGWWGNINPANSEHLIEAGKNPQSLVGTIPVFLTETIGQLPQKRNFLNLSVEKAHLVTNLVRLFFIAFTLYFLKEPFRKGKNKLYEIRAIAYIIMIIPLIFPHQQKYAFILLFPMIVYLSYYSLVRFNHSPSKKFKIFIVLLLLISLNYTPFIGSDLLGRNNYDLIHHYRVLGIETMLLCFFAAYADPEHLKLDDNLDSGT